MNCEGWQKKWPCSVWLCERARRLWKLEKYRRPLAISCLRTEIFASPIQSYPPSHWKTSFYNAEECYGLILSNSRYFWMLCIGVPVSFHRHATAWG
jgi:hypothetical protein